MYQAGQSALGRVLGEYRKNPGGIPTNEPLEVSISLNIGQFLGGQGKVWCGFLYSSTHLQ